MHGLGIGSTHLSAHIPNGNGVRLLANAQYDYVTAHVTRAPHVIRNPLDIVVSAYHSHRNTHPLKEWPELERQRAILKDVSPAEGMMLTLAFLERDDFCRGVVGPLHALRHWDFTDTRYATLRMEDLVAYPALIAPWLPGSQPATMHHTFEKHAGRPKGQLDDASHYRSGLPDQWRTALPPAAIAYIRAHFAPLLERHYPQSLKD